LTCDLKKFSLPSSGKEAIVTDDKLSKSMFCAIGLDDAIEIKKEWGNSFFTLIDDRSFRPFLFPPLTIRPNFI
jgi:hypothetical protein